MLDIVSTAILSSHDRHVLVLTILFSTPYCSSLVSSTPKNGHPGQSRSTVRPVFAKKAEAISFLMSSPVLVTSKGTRNAEAFKAKTLASTGDRKCMMRRVFGDVVMDNGGDGWRRRGWKGGRM